MRIDLDDGKYTVICEGPDNFQALRYGEPWQDLVGNNLVYWLVMKIEELQEREARIRDLAGTIANVECELNGGDICNEDAQSNLNMVCDCGKQILDILEELK